MPATFTHFLIQDNIFYVIIHPGLGRRVKVLNWDYTVAKMTVPGLDGMFLNQEM